MAVPTDSCLMRLGMHGELLMPCSWEVESGRSDWCRVASAFKWPEIYRSVDYALTVCPEA